jgi:ion channel-forming bestrophin family protein
MYVRRRIKIRHMLEESWVVLVFIGLWSITCIYLHEFRGYHWIVMPVLPVTLVGIAVSLYLGFKSVSAYNRWWEARVAVGGISSKSREWVLQVQTLIFNDTETAPTDVVRDLIYRHLGWVYAVAYMLRRTSRLRASKRTRIFRYRRIDHDTPTMHQDPESFGRFLDPAEYAAARTYRNPATYLIRCQAERVRDLTRAGYLDNVRQYEMTALLARLDNDHGTCERIKHTPFPRQIAYFGTVFTWLFIVLLPVAFLGVFEVEAGRETLSSLLTHEFMYSLVPFAMLISWIFFMIEKVGDSSEDPFAGGVNDVPISALVRLIEIDLLQALGESVPPQLEPVDDVLY